jgi:hypothetical protein
VFRSRSRTREPTLTIERWFLSVCYPKAITDDGLVRVLMLVKMYARPVAEALATCDGAVR